METIRPRLDLVSKLDVAKRQLREAIRMFFWQRDTVSIHTLASAAHQVLLDMLKAHAPDQIVNTIFDPKSPFIREEKKPEWNSIINGARNFFKHADKDHDKIYKFYPDSTRYYILDAVMMYFHLSREPFHEASVFQAWFFLSNPNHLIDGTAQQKAILQIKSTIDPNDFGFFREVLENPSRM